MVHPEIRFNRLGARRPERGKVVPIVDPFALSR
jgi:hypothetical protein